MSDTALRQRLIRVASQLPKGSAERRQVLALLLPDSMRSKTAANPKTQKFVEWVMNTHYVMGKRVREPLNEGEEQRPMPPAAVIDFVVNTLRVPLEGPQQSRPGPRFQKGDEVQVKADKHKDLATISAYANNDGKIGVVDSVDGEDALVLLKSGPSVPVRFPGALKPRGVGLYKYTAAFTIEGSAAIEMVYLAGGETTDEQKVVVEQYMGRAREGEKRSANYYTGHVFKCREGKEGPYFQLFPQQRMEINPTSEGGYLARSFNPAKGKVLYVGLVGARPQGWDKQLEEMQIAAGAVKGSED